MLDQNVLARLSQLNRQSILSPAKVEFARSTAPRIFGVPEVPGPQPPRRSALPEGQIVENASGRHLLIRRSLASVWRDAETHVARRVEMLRPAAEIDVDIHPEIQNLYRSLPNDALLLDLETCGLAGSMIFLVGLVYRDDEQLVLAQLLARDYSEEKSLLAALWQIAAEKQVLVTFNGKSFDWPLVHDRSTRHHLGRDLREPRSGAAAARSNPAAGPLRSNPAAESLSSLDHRTPRPELMHCDLLHHCRRLWKDQLPNCKLQTLERYLCGRRRVGDISGAEIPAAYHQFVRTGDALKMRSILHHNALDLVTLLQLSLCVLDEACA